MIYDCFIYNGEKDLLEIRLQETCLFDDWVTTVIVEANATHTGEPKELHFDKYKAEFIKFNVFYFVVNLPVGESPRKMEEFQRNIIKNALKFLEPKPTDKIIISDVDEIPRARAINLALKSGLDFAALIQDKYNYYINLLEGMQIWDRARWMDWEYLRDKEPEQVRNSGYDFSIHHAGWHFSWTGGADAAEKKLKEFSHQELNNEENIKQVRQFKNIWGDAEFTQTEVDLSYPEYLFKNQDKFKNLIL